METISVAIESSETKTEFVLYYKGEELARTPNREDVGEFVLHYSTGLLLVQDTSEVEL